LVLIGTPCQENAIFFFVPIAWVSQPVGEVAIVRHQNEAFALEIQPAHRVDMLRHIHDVSHSLAVVTALALDRRQDVPRLV
jgi:hypothetical protein